MLVPGVSKGLHCGQPAPRILSHGWQIPATQPWPPFPGTRHIEARRNSGRRHRGLRGGGDAKKQPLPTASRWRNRHKNRSIWYSWLWRSSHVPCEFDRWQAETDKLVADNSTECQLNLSSRTASPLSSRTASPLSSRTASPLSSRTASPLGSRTASPLSSWTASPLTLGLLHR